ncbi:HalOD1 output domain-containing protein [Haladaptatus halobius]|uniref:HalOD1 output domain-containing protein n=1 Tax=Haladaptatus halobius TaxID=2884875 RepID=UPI001D0B31CC
MTTKLLTDGGRDRNQSNQSPHWTYDIDTEERPSEAVVRAVAALTDTAIQNLDPLYNVIDPDHIDGIFTKRTNTGGRTELSFEFNGCAVTVTHTEVRVSILE